MCVCVCVREREREKERGREKEREKERERGRERGGERKYMYLCVCVQVQRSRKFFSCFTCPFSRREIQVYDLMGHFPCIFNPPPQKTNLVDLESRFARRSHLPPWEPNNATKFLIIESLRSGARSPCPFHFRGVATPPH